jgi:ketol-acid reductoisomerase
MTIKVYSDRQARLRYLKRKVIAILGYGNQGRAQALNLRDSGLNVIVGLPKGSKSRPKVREDGFDLYPTSQAVRLADVISLLAPDHLHQRIYRREIKPNLSPGKTLLFACGLSVHFKLIVPPDFVDVIMVAPHAPGEVMRNLYLDGKGVPCFIAIKQDTSGDAKNRALAYAKAIGCARAGAFETTFEHEAVGDLFGEQAVLCGGVSELLKVGFEVLVKAGLPPENAYLECVHQLDYIVNTVKAHGIAGMFDRISRTAEYGSYLSGKRVIDKQTKERMTRILKEIQDGSFVRAWLKECETGMKNYDKLKRQAKRHPIEEVSKRMRKYSR